MVKTSFFSLETMPLWAARELGEGAIGLWIPLLNSLPCAVFPIISYTLNSYL